MVVPTMPMSMPMKAPSEWRRGTTSAVPISAQSGLAKKRVMG